VEHIVDNEFMVNRSVQHGSFIPQKTQRLGVSRSCEDGKSGVC